jgi:hypothetical protein
VANELLNHLTPQIIWNLDNVENTYTDAEWLTPFRNKQDWMLAEPYNKFTFDYEHLDFNFIQLCNMVELLQGRKAEFTFSMELGEQVKQIVTERLEYWHDVRMIEGTLDMQYEDRNRTSLGKVSGL